MTSTRFVHVFVVLACGALWLSRSAMSDAAAPLGAKPPAAAPLIIAHRGASAVAPENTLASYSMAIEHGAKLAECDVYLTQDGIPVLLHDRDLERTTNGTGDVETFTLAELKKLDAGSWKDVRYAGERIPTLVEYLHLLRGKMRPVIEIKGKDEGLPAAVIAALRQADFPPEDVMIFSFHYGIIETIVELEPLLPATWLLSEALENDAARRAVLRKALTARVNAIGTSHKDFDPKLLRSAHECGLSLFTWTVNDPARMVELRDLGVDALITDDPALALNVMANQ